VAERLQIQAGCIHGWGEDNEQRANACLLGIGGAIGRWTASYPPRLIVMFEPGTPREVAEGVVRCLERVPLLTDVTLRTLPMHYEPGEPVGPPQPEYRGYPHVARTLVNGRRLRDFG
jgi:hypothetical protein